MPAACSCSVTMQRKSELVKTVGSAKRILSTAPVNQRAFANRAFSIFVQRVDPVFPQRFCSSSLYIGRCKGESCKRCSVWREGVVCKKRLSCGVETGQSFAVRLRLCSRPPEPAPGCAPAFWAGRVTGPAPEGRRLEQLSHSSKQLRPHGALKGVEGHPHAVNTIHQLTHLAGRSVRLWGCLRDLCGHILTPAHSGTNSGRRCRLLRMKPCRRRSASSTLSSGLIGVTKRTNAPSVRPRVRLS